jgi:hypothetical protein
VPFSPLPTAFVEATVRESVPDISPEDAALYAALAQGSAGAALAYAQDDLAAINQALCETLAALTPSTASATSARLLAEAKAVGERVQARESELTDTDALRQGLRAVFVLIATWYRDVLHVMHGSEERLANRKLIELVREAAGSLSAESAASAIRHVAEAERHIRLHVNVQLGIEQLTFKLASASTAAWQRRTA